MERAEYIKKQVLTTNAHAIAPKDEEPEAPSDGGGAAKAKPKTKLVKIFLFISLIFLITEEEMIKMPKKKIK